MYVYYVVVHTSYIFIKYLLHYRFIFIAIIYYLYFIYLYLYIISKKHK